MHDTTLGVQIKRNDDPAFWQSANNHLIRYGGKFSSRIIKHAKGVILTDVEGNEIVDFTSGQMSALLGHGNPEISRAVMQSLDTVNHLFSGMLSPPVVAFAEELASVLPPSLSKTMLLTTGAESNEAAIKLAKLYTGKYEIVGLTASWHGMTQGATAATFSAGRRGYGPSAVGQFVLPSPYSYRSIFRKPDGSHDWETELDYGFQLIDCASTGNLAAVIIEPILSSGGCIELPLGYLRALKTHCEKRGMMLIVDEAQTGLGRTGTMFAFERDGVVPDILTLSKTLGCGLPVATCSTSPEIEAVCASRGYLFYTTHISDPLAAIVALTALRIVKRDNLVQRAQVAGAHLMKRLLELKSKYDCIGDVRGRGLMVGIELVADPVTREAGETIGAAISQRSLDLGLSINIVQLPGMSSVIRMAPPLTITDEELDRALDILEQAIVDSIAAEAKVKQVNGAGVLSAA